MHVEREKIYSQADFRIKCNFLKTNDIVNKILRSKNNHEKEYIVRVNKKITNAFITKMGKGISHAAARMAAKALVQENFIKGMGFFLLTQKFLLFL